MPVQACPNVLRDCDCSGYPVRNFSSETPDVPVFFGNVSGPPDGPLGGDPKYTTEGCLEICESTVSQAAADECALLQEQECTVGPGGTLYRNSAQECDRPCPDGTSFVGSTLAGEVASPWQADADARAYSLACERARLGRICFTTTSPLTPACKGEYFELPLVATGGTPWLVTFNNHVFLPGTCFSETAIGDTFALAWEVTAGSLPAGLALVCTSGLIVGTPTAAGSSSFTIRVTDSLGGYQTRAFTLRVVSLDTGTAPTPPDTNFILPDGTEFDPYSETLAATGTSGVLVWSVVEGSLPDGLDLDPATGDLTGTPEEDGDFEFTVRLRDQAGAGCLCERPYILTILPSIDLRAYWAFEDGGGVADLADSSPQAFDLAQINPPWTSAAGRVGNCAALSFNQEFENPPPAPTTIENPDLGFTVCGWMRAAAGVKANDSIVFINFPLTTSDVELRLDGTDIILEINMPGDDLELTIPYPQDGAWHFYRFGFNPDTGLGGFSLDNGTLQTGVASFPAGLQLQSWHFGDTSNDPTSFDETGYWKRWLTSAEVTAIYNGGSGITWGSPSLPS